MTKTMHKEKSVDETAESTTGTDVALAGNNPVVATGLSLDDVANDAGIGLKNITATDLATPMVYILQSNSGQVKRSDPKYIEGALEGDIYNNVTQERFRGAQGIIVVPCEFEKTYVEWKPNRGGLVAVHGVDTPLKHQVKMVVDSATGKQTPTLPNGNVLAETNNHYALILHEDGFAEPVIFPMTSTALKASRLWNSLMSKVVVQKKDGTSFTPASYYMTYKLTTKPRTKDTLSWMTWVIEPNGPVQSKIIYDKAKAFNAAVSGGKVKVKLDDAIQPDAQPIVVTETEADDGIPF